MHLIFFYASCDGGPAIAPALRPAVEAAATRAVAIADAAASEEDEDDLILYFAVDGWVYSAHVCGTHVALATEHELCSACRIPCPIDGAGSCSGCAVHRH